MRQICSLATLCGALQEGSGLPPDAACRLGCCFGGACARLCVWWRCELPGEPPRQGRVCFVLLATARVAPASGGVRGRQRRDDAAGHAAAGDGSRLAGARGGGGRGGRRRGRGAEAAAAAAAARERDAGGRDAAARRRRWRRRRRRGSARWRSRGRRAGGGRV